MYRAIRRGLAATAALLVAAAAGPGAQSGAPAWLDAYRDRASRLVGAPRATVRDIASLLVGVGASRIGASGGGADIGPSVEAANVPSMSLDVDGSLYFTVHHAQADTVDKIEPVDLARCVAALAVMGYVVADVPARLGR